MSRFRDIAGIGMLVAYCFGRALRMRKARPLSVEQRLAMLPLERAPVAAPVRIHWDAHQIPFIEADSDHDLAVALGVVHAHLRLGQMELMRRIAQGRVAEMAGPAGIELDRAVRAMGIARAVPEMEAALDPATRSWVEGFAAGVNHHLTQARARPLEFGLLAIRPEPWTVSDVLTVGRLAGADVSWMLLSRLLSVRSRIGPEQWPTLWRRLLEEGSAAVPSFAGNDRSAAGIFGALIAAFGRTGSNSVAVGAARSATGAALIASDPHLSISLPNLWLIAGFKSPSHHAVGFMIPGLPFVALGRNPRIAWGGTNLHAASSDIFDLSAAPPESLITREATIRVRWWGRTRVRWRDSAHGPIVSDSALFRRGPPLALRWVGHRPSNEIGAMLAVNRARNWDEFRSALEGFAVPGQTMIYADVEGRVGKVIAAHLPRRPSEHPPDLVADLDRHSVHWNGFETSRGLPSEIDPSRGFVASANDPPPDGGVPVGFFFSSPDRINRLQTQLGSNAQVTPDDLSALQRDVYLASAVALRDLLMPRLKAVSAARSDFIAVLEGWDGHYQPESRGALAFELMLFHLVREIVPHDRLSAYSVVWTTVQLVAADIAQTDPATLDSALAGALSAAQPSFGQYENWGGLHRMRIAHLLAAAPGLGRRFVFDTYPVGGSNDTLMKTAHGISGKPHTTRYGACARHVSDMSDPDSNGFCLLGGQDGWFGSASFMDQVPLWRAGSLITVPLRPETARAAFPYHSELRPA